MKATAEEKRKIARRITDVLLEVRETSESSGEFRALMERLVLLIDAAVVAGRDPRRGAGQVGRDRDLQVSGRRDYSWMGCVRIACIHLEGGEEEEFLYWIAKAMWYLEMGVSQCH